MLQPGGSENNSSYVAIFEVNITAPLQAAAAVSVALEGALSNATMLAALAQVVAATAGLPADSVAITAVRPVVATTKALSGGGIGASATPQQAEPKAGPAAAAAGGAVAALVLVGAAMFAARAHWRRAQVATAAIASKKLHGTTPHGRSAAAASAAAGRSRLPVGCNTRPQNHRAGPAVRGSPRSTMSALLPPSPKARAAAARAATSSTAATGRGRASVSALLPAVTSLPPRQPRGGVENDNFDCVNPMLAHSGVASEAGARNSSVMVESPAGGGGGGGANNMWVRIVEDDGDIYFEHIITGETTRDEPPPASEDVDNGNLDDAVDASAGNNDSDDCEEGSANHWLRIIEDDGDVYFENSVTGEQTRDEPPTLARTSPVSRVA